MKLQTFITKANQEMYASENKQEEKLADGCKVIIFEQEKFKAVDVYYGFDPFIGQMIVFENNKFVWGMNYYGKILSDSIDKKELYLFLRKAMRSVKEDRPYRGPEIFIENDWRYTDTSTGNLESFEGQETIFYKNKKVYSLQYQGGKIKK